jgi:hypothetical protein
MLTHAGAVARLCLLGALSLAVMPAQESPQEPSRTRELTEGQKRALQALEAESTAKAAAGLLRLPQLARAFNANLLSPEPDPQIERQLGDEMADIFAQAIRLRLFRIRSAARILTAEQRLAVAAELQKPDAPYLFDDLVRKVLVDPKK